MQREEVLKAFWINLRCTLFLGPKLLLRRDQHNETLVLYAFPAVSLAKMARNDLIHYLERLVDFWRKTGSFAAGNKKLVSEMVWPHFWAIQTILFVLIAVYCTIHELARAIGKEKLLRIFFGPLPVPQVGGPPREATGVLRHATTID